MASTSPLLSLKLRSTLRRVPGLLFLAEAFRETPGSWLFRRPTSAWLGDPYLVSQLPSAYRLFACYCATQPGNPFGAELLLRAIIWHRRITRASLTCRLDVSGTSIFVDLSDPRFLAIPPELSSGLPRVLQSFLGPGDTFIDVGANHGTFSVSAAGLVGPDGLVVAIEPQPRLAALVRQSLALQGTPAAVHNVACGDSTGSAVLYVPTATSGSGGLHPGHSAISLHRTTTVPLLRLDDLLPFHQVPGRVFVKLDIEGSEAKFLTGARNFLAHTKAPILMEINGPALEAAGTTTEALIAILHDCGYNRCLHGDNFDIPSALSTGISASNIIALHQSVDLSILRR